MDLSEIGEFGLIERIRQIIGAETPPLIKGIGDDAAVIASDPASVILLTSDAMAQGRHFQRQWMSPRQIGFRAAAAALSDIAAMGGAADAILCTLCLPPTWSVEEAEELVGGVQAVAGSFGISLAGGDIVAADGPLLIDVIVVGRAERDNLWLRENAQVGDRILVTGALGDAAAAIALFSSHQSGRRDEFPQLMQSLTAPVPRLEAAAALAPLGKVHAAIDISDGLLQDAGHVAAASDVAMRLWASDVPVSRQLLECAGLLGADPLSWAAAGGEDFELLLTAAPADVPDLQATLRQASVHLTDIGEVAAGSDAHLLDDHGHEIHLVTAGWNHFRGA